MQRILYFMAILSLLGMAFPAGISRAYLMEKAEGCKKITGASDVDLQNMFKPVPATTASAKCLRACIMKEFDIMNQNGTLNHAAAVDYPVCFKLVVSDNHCEAAEEYNSCFLRESKKNEKQNSQNPYN